MRTKRRSSEEESKRKKKKRQASLLEGEIMAIIQKSMKTAIDMALDDLLKGFQ